MEPIDLKKKSTPKRGRARTPLRLIRKFPRTHALAAAGLAMTLGLVAALPSEQASASRQSVAIALPELMETPVDHETMPEDTLAAWEASVDPNVTEIEQVVKSGDSLSSIFNRAGLSDRDMLEVVNACPEGKALAKLYPGHRFVFQVDDEGVLQSLTHEKDHLNRQRFTRDDSGFAHESLNRKPDLIVTLRKSVINSSLYKAGKDAQLDDQLIMELASIFGWDVDFALDIRAGDSFKILFEEKYLDGERIGVGAILAAEFVNQNSTFKAVRYVDENGEAQYYTPTGKAMRKAFLRAPLDFRRISSNFNPRRLHPIYKTVRPHRGTDYAANRGTPVWASGEGRVIASGYTKPNGNYIVIQHGGDIQTKYLHLHKRFVKRGDRVKQRQVIGSVGSTGYSTAPHLHYEFLVNGVHRNPRTIVQKLPKAESIDEDELPRFFTQTQPLVAQLEQTTRVASAEADTTSL